MKARALHFTQSQAEGVEFANFEHISPDVGFTPVPGPSSGLGGTVVLAELAAVLGGPS